MKRLCVLQQGGHKSGNETADQIKVFKGIADFYRLNWAGDESDKMADIIIKRPTTWTEGRQLLYEWVNRRHGFYDYYLFLDDDLRLKKHDTRQLPVLLEEWSPLCGAFHDYSAFEQSVPWDGQRIKDADSVHRYCLHDESHNLLHRSVVEALLPMPFHGPGAWMRYIERFVYQLYPEKMARFEDIWSVNFAHRDRGEGHGNHSGPAYNKMLKQFDSISKIPLIPRSKEKKLAAKRNAELSRTKPDKKPVSFDPSRLTEIIDVSHPIWANRAFLFDQYKWEIIE